MTHRYLITIFFTLSITCAFCFAQDNQECYSQIIKANELFNQANAQIDFSLSNDLYTQAAQSYEQIISQSKIANSGLYYNLGNCYLMSNNLGSAILNYRRALKLNDSNYDLRKNLSIARSKRIDKIEINTQEKISKRLFFWHYSINQKSKFIVVYSSAVILMWIFAFKTFFPKLPSMRALSILIILICASFGTSLFVDTYANKNINYGVILADSIIARQGDGENYDKSFKEPLHEGTEFKILEQRRDWWRIELTNNDNTWIPASVAEVI